MKPLRLFFTLLVVALVAACSKTATEDSAKSLAYFSAHSAEAELIAKKCLVFERDDFSTMSPSQQQAWKNTAAGVNCDNAKQAYGTAIWNADQRELRAAAAKYSEPASTKEKK